MQLWDSLISGSSSPDFQAETNICLPVVKTVRRWTNKANLEWQASLYCTGWIIFEAATTELDERTDTMIAYISFCEYMCVCTYNKSWFTAKLKQLYQAKEEVYRSGNRILYNQARNMQKQACCPDVGSHEILQGTDVGPPKEHRRPPAGPTAVCLLGKQVRKWCSQHGTALHPATPWLPGYICKDPVCWLQLGVQHTAVAMKKFPLR